MMDAESMTILFHKILDYVIENNGDCEKVD